MKYADVLEIVIIILLAVMLGGFLNRHYLCSVEYSVPELNITGINFSFNFSPVLYTKEETLFILENNRELSYRANISCNLHFEKNKK